MVYIRTIGILILLYGIGAPLAVVCGAPLKTSPQFYEAATLFILVGGGMFGMTFWDKVYNFFTQKAAPIVASGDTETPPRPTNLEELDLLYLYHLADRAKESKDKEAVFLVKELQDHFFDIHHEVKDAQDIAKPATGVVITS